MKFEVLVLGTNAALPVRDKITSAQIVNAGDNLYLLDCGEGTQMKLAKYRVKRNKIKAIFITHLHGDHLFGLPGLLTSLGHHHRKEKLFIFGPVGIARFVNVVLETCRAFLGYEIEVRETDTTIPQSIYKDNKINIRTIPLKHRVPTNGYLLTEEPRPYNIDVEKIKKYRLSVEQIKSVKAGNNLLLSDGTFLNWQELIIPPLKLRSYAYCTDTIYDESIVPMIEGVDLLYHETTYLDDMTSEAADRMHSTISEAAKIARLAGVNKLLTGHYSGRYDGLNAFLEAGKKIFKNTLIAEEGLVVSV